MVQPFNSSAKLSLHLNLETFETYESNFSFSLVAVLAWLISPDPQGRESVPGLRSRWLQCSVRLHPSAPSVAMRLEDFKGNVRTYWLPKISTGTTVTLLSFTRALESQHSSTASPDGNQAMGQTATVATSKFGPRAWANTARSKSSRTLQVHPTSDCKEKACTQTAQTPDFWTLELLFFDTIFHK